jgi:hypothetical protein
VPGYEFCLGCGVRNPRGAQVRFEYDDRFIWKRQTPLAHFRCGDGTLSLAYHCIVGDELGWWMGALRQGECGLSNRVVLTLGDTVRHGTPVLALGSRSTVRTSDPKGRIWQTEAAILAADWRPLATAAVQFVGSRAFTQMMLPGFIQEGGGLAALQRAFPRYKDQLTGKA